MSSSLRSSHPHVNAAARKTNKKIEDEGQGLRVPPPIPWKVESQHQLYLSKLRHALRQLGLSSLSPPQRRVRDAAYRVLATTAKGRTRWSRAILTSRRMKLKKFVKQDSTAKRHRKLMAVITTTGNSGFQRKVASLKPDGLPAFRRKARLLSRLIPGCQNQPVEMVLREAMDYIPALEMQVRAMTGLVEMFSRAGSSAMVSNTIVGGLGSSWIQPS